MSSNIEQTVIEKLRALPPEQQEEVLRFVESLSRRLKNRTPPERMTIWADIDEIIKEVPAEAWDELPSDGSLNVDHYLYGAPKKL